MAIVYFIYFFNLLGKYGGWSISKFEQVFQENTKINSNIVPVFIILKVIFFNVYFFKFLDYTKSLGVYIHKMDHTIIKQCSTLSVCFNVVIMFNIQADLIKLPRLTLDLWPLVNMHYIIFSLQISDTLKVLMFNSNYIERYII